MPVDVFLDGQELSPFCRAANEVEGRVMLIGSKKTSSHAGLKGQLFSPRIPDPEWTEDPHAFPDGAMVSVVRYGHVEVRVPDRCIPMYEDYMKNRGNK
jgi:hypothetical protein